MHCVKFRVSFVLTVYFLANVYSRNVTQLVNRLQDLFLPDEYKQAKIKYNTTTIGRVLARQYIYDVFRPYYSGVAVRRKDYNNSIIQRTFI